MTQYSTAINNSSLYSIENVPPKNTRKDRWMKKAALQMKRKLLVIGVILFLVLLSAVFLYFYHPFLQVLVINQSVDTAGIKLLMPLGEVTRKMNGEGQYIPGMGGFGYRYDSEKIEVFFSGVPDGRAYNKACFIETENPDHSVLGVRPGDSLDDAVSMLDKSGFKKIEQNYYENGDVYIYLNPENTAVKKIRIGFIDRSLSGRVY